MFDDEALSVDQEIRDNWQEQYERQYKGRSFSASTASGIPIKPVYSAADVAGADIRDIGMPGVFPYTRGIYPLHYQFQPWMNRLIHGFGLPEQARERMDMLAREGMTGYGGQPSYNIIFDLVTKAGYDPDAPEARGLVGHGGITLCTIEDMDRLFHDLPLDKTAIVHNVGSVTMAEMAMFLVYAERRGYRPDQLRGNSMNWLYKAPLVDYAMFPPEGAFTLMVQFIKYCCRNMPQWNTTNLCGYFVEEKGGTSVQEVGFTLATGMAVSEACIRAGLSPDEFLPRFSFQFAVGNDFFEEVAKLRVLRRLWAKLTKERLGAKSVRSMQMRMHTHTAGSSLVAQQPLVNIARASLQTLACVLGGSNSIHTSAYDEAYSIPTEEAATLALRTQQVILHETGVPNVSDPLAGSYYVEALTNRIEEEAGKIIAKIDELGYVNCWKNGWFKSELERSAYQWREAIDQGERVVVGVNKYIAEETTAVDVFRVDPQIEEVAAARVQEYRARRDNEAVKKGLDEMREAARAAAAGKGELMPAVLGAARRGATLGELQGVLREVFGWGYS